MPPPLLSIGMIVKNEERCLEKCLKALQPLREAIPCQLVIADTGSTDATRDVAARYANILFDFPWVNDFSAARNAVLDRCTGKWYLTVDADEYLDSDFHELADFLTGPEADQYSRGCVNQYSYPDIEMKEDGVDFLAPRMARLSADLRYFGSIHEAFPGVPITQVKILAGVKLHHDGYAADPKHPERARHKSERYLDLLDAELKKSPHNLRRLLQCVEASPQFPARHIEYVRKAMHALRKACQTGNHNDYGPAICRYALMAAVGQQMPELEAWWQWSRQTFPHSMFLRLDGNFILLDWYTQQRQYEKVPELAEAYLTAWRDYQERNFDLLELLHSALYRTGQKDEAHARASGGLSLAHLGRLSEAAELLAAEPDWAILKPADLRSLLTGCAWVAKENLIQSIVADAAEVIFALPGRDGQERQDALRLTAAWLFQPRSPGPETPESPWCVFLKVRGTLGLAARIMETDSTGEMRELLFSVNCWKDFPAPALSRILEQQLPLPESFYHISSEELAAFAAALTQGGIRFARTAADWLTHQPPRRDAGRADLAAGSGRRGAVYLRLGRRNRSGRDPMCPLPKPAPDLSDKLLQPGVAQRR